MQAAASRDLSAASLPIGTALASGALPVLDRDVSAGLDDPVQGAAIDHQVLDHREGRGAPWLDPDLVAVLEAAHVQLAGGDAFVGPVGRAVDHHAAGAADALAAVVLEGDRLFALLDQLLVDDVQHLQERSVIADVRRLVGGERSGGLGGRLAPDVQGEVHYL